MDFETAKVMFAAVFSLATTAAAIQWTLNIIISILTICYLWRKITRKPTTQNQIEEEDEDTME